MPSKHAVSSPYPPFAVAGGRLEVHQVPVLVDNFTWLLVDPRNHQAAAIDGAVLEPVQAYLDAKRLHLTTIFTTHTHWDHIGLHQQLDKRGLLAGVRVIGNRELADAIPGLDHPLGQGVDEGDTVEFAGVQAQVMRTEGHMNGHLSYVFPDVLFCGDTLFAGGCGYLFDGPAEAMHASLQRLAALDPQTRVCCAHEYTQDNLRFAWSVEPDNPALADRIRRVWALRERGESSVPSTIADELATNPFLRGDEPGLRARVHAAMADEPMDTPAQVFAATRKLKDAKVYKSMTDA
ncbi:MAG: hydroxyacylglutathione hydrolase, partial [Myxococcales bacterium]|nr:hydroxyacylglutathione hydrolase [Myxococcales bacterium]